ncbi:prolyl oligopeptidase family serine peptidase [Hymenobacter chitinivorans]|uniref:prolyl oligopeptidase n=1 Tax=Hymenobacter chitinivorans DSM 11115 TaxID=1121954 RepID=A0A2M9BL77_9BACT|nr:prolyl oligopeptidase family serine peptidase [Hymenobacter chitinivorans]PJJ58681.1 prolyl oligopeptidase [Hymenobacter chitinivorans DSM 11115]
MRNLLFLLPSLSVPLAALAQPAAPVAPVRPMTDTYFGQTVTDPYRWLEDVKSAETQAWMHGQADYARQQLDQLPDRAALYARIQELGNAAAARTGRYQRRGQQLFYLKRGAAENLYKLYTRPGMQGAEKLVFDPEKLPATPGQHWSIAYFTASPDGRTVAIGVAGGGSENAVVKLIDTATGRQLDADLPRARFSSPEWQPDSRAFFYSRTREMTPGVKPGDEFTKVTSYRHQLGTAPTADVPVLGYDYAPPSVALKTINEEAFVEVPAGAAVPTAVALIERGTRRELELYVAPLAGLTKPRTTAWQKVCGAADEVTAYAVQGDNLYLLSHKNAPRFQVLRTSLSKPNLAMATVVVPQMSSVVQEIFAAKDALYLQLLDGGPNQFARLPHGQSGAAVELLPLPFPGAGVFEVIHDPRQAGIWAGLTSWTRWGDYFAYDPAARRFTATQLEPQSPYDNPADLEVAEVKVKSHDGTLVPLSIVYKKGLKRDGTAPVLLQGYGAYGSSQAPIYDATYLTLLERGAVLAVAHVRGGGEYGQEWYKAGYQATKPNTWKDFIACAEYLIKEGYTTPARLTGQGTSAGGILIGRAVTERPDLFGAAVFNVGCLDAVRFETTANGQGNIPEFGSVKTEAGFRALAEMSTYGHIQPGTKYPAVLLIHGVNDRRVDVWQSLKTAAKLQAATASGRPVLLRLDFDAGHGMGSTKDQRYQQLADIMALVLSQNAPATAARN